MIDRCSATQATSRSAPSPRLPAALPVLPLRETVPLPDTLTPLAIGQERSVQLVNDVLAGDRMLVMVASREPELETPGPDDLYDVGVVGVDRAHAARCPTARCACSCRAASASAIVALDAGASPTSWREIEELPDARRRADARAHRAHAQRAGDVHRASSSRSRTCPRSCSSRSPTSTTPRALSHLIAGVAALSTEEKQALLEEPDVAERLRRLVAAPRARARGHLDRARRSRRRSSPSSTRTSASTSCASSSRRSRTSSASSTRCRPRPTSCASSSTSVELPEEVRRQVDRELAPPGAACRRRPPSTASSAATSSGSPSLPWDASTEDDLDLAHAREVLDADHYDIEQVKDRILEFLAVRRLKPGRAGLDPLLRRPARRRQDVARPSIARALGREFERISVGGVRDEAEIRGHRRTYVGAMPGVDHPRAARRRLATTRCS